VEIPEIRVRAREWDAERRELVPAEAHQASAPDRGVALADRLAVVLDHEVEVAHRKVERGIAQHAPDQVDGGRAGHARELADALVGEERVPGRGQRSFVAHVVCAPSGLTARMRAA